MCSNVISEVCKKKIESRLGKCHTHFNATTCEADTDRSQWVWGQPDLESDFQASQDCGNREKLSWKTKRRTNKQKTRKWDPTDDNFTSTIITSLSCIIPIKDLLWTTNCMKQFQVGLTILIRTVSRRLSEMIQPHRIL